MVKMNTNTENIREKENRRVFKQLVTTFISEENKEIEKEQLPEASIKIIPKIFYDDFTKRMKVEFKVGNKQTYKIKNLPEFYDRFLNKETYKYGAKLEFVHQKESFDEQSLPILEFLLKYAEIIKYTNEATSSYKYYGKTFLTDGVIISNTGLDDLFNAMNGGVYTFQVGGLEKNISFLNEEPNIEFNIEQIENNKFSIETNIDVFSFEILRGKEFVYFWIKDNFYRCSSNFQNTTLKVLEVFRKNYVSTITFNQNDLETLFSFLIPKISMNVNTDTLSEEVKEKYIPKKLGTKIYLDYNEKNYITADVSFNYGNIEFNPLKNEEKNFARNMLIENEILKKFIDTGFMLDTENYRLVLSNEERIYHFLEEEIEDYMKQFEVLATNNFKRAEIKPFKMKSVGVKIENNLLNVDLSNIGISINEVAEIMQKYRQKKKFHRLKDGTYIKIEQNETVDFIEEIMKEGEGFEIKNGKLNLPLYRSLYLDKLLRKLENVEVTRNDEYKKIIENTQKEKEFTEMSLPINLNANMRTYQKTGYQWLKVLDKYQFGGILADDMGLGKTLQVLSVVLSYVEQYENENNKCQEENGNFNIKKAKPSIVICPSSLTLNWLSEAKKFTPTLKVEVISGNAEERKRKINNIENYNLVITSYDSLKRDKQLYEEKNFQFKYSIADEAQYIKNNHTQNARAIKNINAETRYALTGTPIENSLSELWSIFDYIMPGYLYSYRKFREKFEVPIIKENNVEKMQKLKNTIEPFVLRRIKKEVLTELPDKTVTVLENEMQEEQEMVYKAYLTSAKKEVMEEIDSNGFENSQIKILALLMRLRQICCHPSLFLQDYKGESSKLNQCIELIEGATSSGHKILLFSGYTSMFEMIEERLKQSKINYLKLTGQTKVADRIELVDRFNEDKEIKVFLISLKAGGTGLNLTGADMVIHYDPWWNLSAENQATDRTYRIGQKNNVQVYKLITKNSIEEKIYELQQKKAKLADSMLSVQDTFIYQLSKEDIMELFS